MNINRNNYEEYFIDYLDGKLDEQETACLMLFLGENPDLEDELNMLSKVELQKPVIKFPKKDTLKHFDFSNPSSIFSKPDEFCIAFLEGDLDETRKNQFEKEILNNSELSKTFELTKKCKLEPDTTIVFNKKSLLKKSSGRVITLRKLSPYIAIAASITIFFLLFPGINSKPNNSSGNKVNYFSLINISRPVFNNNTELEYSSEQEVIINTNRNITVSNYENLAENNIILEKQKGTYISSIKIQENEETSVPISKKMEKSFDINDIVKYSENNISLRPIFDDKENSNENNTGNKRFRVWRSLETGVNTITQFAFNKKIFENEYNEDGSIKKLDINTKLIAFESSFK